MPVNTKPSHANKESSGEPEHSDETNTAKRKWQPAELKPRAQPEPHPVAPPDREDTSTEDTPSDSIPSQDLPAAEPTIRIHEQARPTPSPPPISRDHTKAEPTRRIPHISPEPSGSRPTRPPENYTAAKPTRRIPAAEPTRRIPPQEPAQPKDTSAWEPTQRIPILSQRGTPRTQPTQRPTRPTGDEPTVAVHRTPPPPPPSSPPSSPTQTLRAKAAEPRQRQGLSWAQVLLWLTASGVALFFLGLVAAVIGYIVVAAQLPSPEELRMREPKFASSQILDHDGHLLYEIVDPNTGKRTYVPISQISRYVQLATVATEDRNFYAHSGFDPIALARAIYYALQEREIVSGASTITQQVARNILMSAEERAERTAARKIKEIVLATELTRKYSKDEILEIYLNNNNYGNLAYGIDAAARTYFNTTAKDLTLSQATFLAGIPQAPAVYDPYHGGRDAALKRHKIVLGLMVEAGFITQEQADTAAAEMETHPFQPMYTDRIPAPHFVFYVRQWVETNLGADLLYQGSGLRIYTTLDPRLQAIAEEEVANGVAALANRNVSNGALVAIEPATGYILAMVGSADFYNEAIDGQVNVTQRCRQPGSAIKPLTYLSALEKGWTPATIVWDLPTTYTDTAGNVYRPVNYDGQFRGPTAVRTALANSLNIPAVKALEFVTVNGLLEISKRLGATSLVSPQLECPDYPYENRPLYGLALTLGGGEMKPLDLTAAYATFANNGRYLEPLPILRIEDSQGNILIDNRRREGKQVISPQHAYLLNHILSDTRARCLVFQCPSILELPDRSVAAKTGTTNDYRDAWTVGYTPDLATGVWVGNNNNAEMLNVVGSSGAGPIWNAFMRRAHEGIPQHPFPRPPGIMERQVCALSGTEPSPYCPEQRSELFYQEQLPPDEAYDWFQVVEIDANSGLRANEFCQNNVSEKVMVVLENVEDPDGRRWLKQWAMDNNFEIAPEAYCTESDQTLVLMIAEPQENDTVSGTIEIRGTVNVPEFDHYEITYGIGNNPQGWGWISGPHEAIVRDGLIGIWEPGDLKPGVYTLRIVAYNRRGTQFEKRVIVSLVTPTPTPTPETTATTTPGPTDTPTAQATSTPTGLPEITPSATLTLIPLPSPTPPPPTIPPPVPSPTDLPIIPPTSPPTLTPVPVTEEPSPTATPPPGTVPTTPIATELPPKATMTPATP